METWRSRINWPFMALLLLAVLAVLGRIVLVQHFGVPRILRHHLADFCFAGFFTFVITSLAALLRRSAPHKVRSNERRGAWMAIPVIGTAVGLWVELEDYFEIDEDDGGFDPGVVLEWLGAPNTDTFDPMDLVAIFLGGVLAFLLQKWSVQHINRWRRSPLALHPQPHSQ